MLKEICDKVVISHRPCFRCGRRHRFLERETIILAYDGIYPIIQARPEDKTGFLTFYCEYCKQEHLHGEGTGHRVAHCHYTDQSQSPFLEHGYILQGVS